MASGLVPNTNIIFFFILLRVKYLKIFSIYDLVHSLCKYYYLDDLGADIFVHIVLNWDTAGVIAAEEDDGVHHLKQALFVCDRYDEVALVDAFGSFSQCEDADGRERISYACEK